MPSSWILLADFAGARIVAGLSLGRPFEIMRFRAADAMLPANGAGPPPVVELPAAEVDAEHLRIAAELAEYLGRAYREGSLERLTLIAPEPLLSAIRSCLSPELRRLVIREFGQSWARLSPAEIAGRLEATAHAAGR
jgi:hypothetical protein